MQRVLRFGLLVLLTACGVPEGEHRALLAERDSLVTKLTSVEKELDDLKYGPERLLGQASRAFEGDDFSGARTFASMLLERHPNAPERPKAERIRAEADRRIKEAEERARREREAAERRERERRERALASTRKKRDDIRSVTWYYHRNTPQYINSRSDIHLYVGRFDSGTINPRLEIRYVADDWLFIRNFVIKTDDRTFAISMGHFDVERDNGSGEIWEWIDIPAEAREMEILRAIAESEKAVIRHEGSQYYKDRTITSREKQAIRDMLSVYESLKTM